MKIAPLEPGQTRSRVISRKCASGKQPTGIANAGDVLLMRWYEHAGWDYDDQIGIASIYGEAPCDTEGYGITNLSYFWENHISSYRVYNGCYVSRVWTGSYFSGTRSARLYGDIHHFGSTFNDNIDSIWIRHTY